MALIVPSDDPAFEPPQKIRKVYVTFRCGHWREAFQKARSLGISQEKSKRIGEAPAIGSNVVSRWQFMGINDVIPVPLNMEDGATISDFEESEYLPPLQRIFDKSFEDYHIESYVGEERCGEYYRTLVNPEEAGF
ncbi:hypothetical protein GCM10007100_40270 [Roseibacillus persicicus]|uniref:Uncharacterized protein n=2 Tax=Roseibacillus persicicus TaxID=454148 RepID=A0A918TZG9_9BACT|nr:hypothetical protein GCM10007100_40270 [Roseibacillus persicicus]